MLEINTGIKMGEIIMFSSGEYSDYGYVGEVVFLKSCDIKKYAARFIDEVVGFGEDGDPNWWKFHSMNVFVSWLVSQRVCVPLECREMHLGEYGRFSEEIWSNENEQ